MAEAEVNQRTTRIVKDTTAAYPTHSTPVAWDTDQYTSAGAPRVGFSTNSYQETFGVIRTNMLDDPAPLAGRVSCIKPHVEPVSMEVDDIPLQQPPYAINLRYIFSGRIPDGNMK